MQLIIREGKTIHLLCTVQPWQLLSFNNIESDSNFSTCTPNCVHSRIPYLQRCNDVGPAEKRLNFDFLISNKI